MWNECKQKKKDADAALYKVRFNALYTLLGLVNL